MAEWRKIDGGFVSCEANQGSEGHERTFLFASRWNRATNAAPAAPAWPNVASVRVERVPCGSHRHIYKYRGGAWRLMIVPRSLADAGVH